MGQSCSSSSAAADGPAGAACDVRFSRNPEPAPVLVPLPPGDGLVGEAALCSSLVEVERELAAALAENERLLQQLVTKDAAIWALVSGGRASNAMNRESSRDSQNLDSIPGIPTAPPDAAVGPFGEDLLQMVEEVGAEVELEAEAEQEAAGAVVEYDDEMGALELAEAEASLTQADGVRKITRQGLTRFVEELCQAGDEGRALWKRRATSAAVSETSNAEGGQLRHEVSSVQ